MIGSRTVAVTFAAGLLLLPAGPLAAAVIDAGSTCASLQAALNSASGGDAVQLAAGRLFDCGTTTLYLPVHSGNRFVTVRTSAYRNLPPGGVRICPAGSTAAAATVTYPCTPNVQSSGGTPGSTGGDLAILQFDANFVAGLQANLGIHHWRFVGLEIRGESTVLWSTLFSLDMYGAPGGTSAGRSSSTVRDRARAIEIDRCWIHGYYEHYGPQKALQADGSAIVVRDSVFEEFKASGQDGQGIFSESGPGPLTVMNTFLAGGAENFFTGGATSNWRGTMPALIVFRGNYSTRDVRWWRIISSGVNPQGACTSGRWVLNSNTNVWWQCNGGQWLQGVCGQPGQPACPDRNVYKTLKNLLEFKAIKTALVEGNLFDGQWAAAQSGTLLMPNAAPSQNGYGFVLQDVGFRYNRISHTSTAIGMASSGSNYRPGDGMRIEHNLFDSILVPERTGALSGYAGSSYLLMTGPQMAPYGTRVRHNTEINSAWPGTYLGGGYHPNGVYGDGTPRAYCPFCQVLDNVLTWNDAPIGGQSGPSVNTFFGTSGWHYWDYGRASGNIFAKDGRAPAASDINDYKAPCCDGNRIVNLTSDALDASGRVKATYQGLATDASDPGADMDSLWALSGTAASGLANPYLQFRLGSWLAASTGATLYYQAPGGAFPTCAVLVSEKETLNPSSGAVAQSASGPARAAVVSGLRPATLYYYAVTCGQMKRRGNFRTRP